MYKLGLKELIQLSLLPASLARPQQLITARTTHESLSIRIKKEPLSTLYDEYTEGWQMYDSCDNKPQKKQ